MGFEIDVNAAVEEATDLDTFDVFEFLEGANTPQNKVTIYTDADAALKVARFLVNEKERNERSKQMDQYSLADDYDEEEENLSEEELTELHNRLTASALTFELKGLAPAARKALEKKLQATTDYSETEASPEYNRALDGELVARSILSVTNAKGQKSSNKWTAENVLKLTDTLYESEAGKLFQGVGEINYVGAVFDRAVTADFS